MKSLFTVVIIGLLASSLITQAALAGRERGAREVLAATLAVDAVTADFAVMVLGSGGPVATENGRAGSSLLIFVEKTPVLLMDTGSGSFKSLALSGARLTDVENFLYTHLHIDHTSDMSAMIKSLFFHRLGAGLLLPNTINFYGPVSKNPGYDSMSKYISSHYVGPDGVERYLNGFANAFFGGASAFVPVGNDLPSDSTSTTMTTVLADLNGLRVKSIPVFHGGTPSLAYRIEYKGKSIVWSGDTNSSTDNMITISTGANVLIYDTAILETPVPEFLLMFHTTPTRIGEVAAAAAPANLVLSHLSIITENNLGLIQRTIRQQGFRGTIIPASDLQVINVP